MSFDACSIGGCEKPQKAHTWCAMHYMRWRRNGDPASVSVGRTYVCAGCCSVRATSNLRGRFPKLCPECKSSRSGGVRRAKGSKKRVPCLGCGKIRWRSNEVPLDRQKCRECRRAAWSRECLGCGARFVRYKGVYCSVACANSARSEARIRPRPCAGCGVEVRNTGTKPLCKPCARVAELERARRKNRKRRYVGIVHEPYTLAQIAERDGFRCGLCRRKVDMRLKNPHPMAPTIDHIIPLIFSMDDTRVNVQLAHRSCNTAKGARCGGEQLALIG